ncbi:hypothetical protein FCV25MIE_10579 [Fagus crenata]
MEKCTDNKRKREQDDSGINSPEPKRIRFDSDDLAESTLLRVDSNNSELNSPEVHRIQEDLLNILDDSDVTDRDPAIQGLDSVIKSFEEEIQVQDPLPAVFDLTSDSGESQPELGYLLEASDDELGLPPTSSSGEETKIEAVDFEASSSYPNPVGLDGILGFENEMPGYDSFGFGIGFDSESYVNDIDGEFVALGGLFDYSDQSYEPAGTSELSWLPESLPAL